MEKEDSFPQRVWQIVAAIPKAMSPLTVMWRNWQDRPVRAPGGRCVKAPARRQHFALARVVNRHGTISLTGPDLQRQRRHYWQKA